MTAMNGRRTGRAATDFPCRVFAGYRSACDEPLSKRRANSARPVVNWGEFIIGAAQFQITGAAVLFSASSIDFTEKGRLLWSRLMKLSVVIPAYNERATIAEIIRRVQAVDIPKEIIVVDDGSTDGTRELLTEMEKQHGNLRIFLQPKNRGKGAALRLGFQHSTGDYVLVQDADLEYDPADYSVLLKPLVEGKADVVYGSRFLTTKEHRVLFFWHSVGNRFLTLISNMFTNLNLTDMETGYKAFRREVIQSIRIEQNRFGFEPEVTVKIARMKLRIYEVGISYYGRTYEEGKKIGWKDGVKALWCIFKYSLRSRKRDRLPEPLNQPARQTRSAPDQL